MLMRCVPSAGPGKRVRIVPFHAKSLGGKSDEKNSLAI